MSHSLILQNRQVCFEQKETSDVKVFFAYIF